jgi:hypothetical protein
MCNWNLSSCSTLKFFEPAVPLLILNASIIFSNYILSGLQCPCFIWVWLFKTFGSISWGFRCLCNIRVMIICPSNRSPRIFDASVVFELWISIPRIILFRPAAPLWYSSCGFRSLESFSLGHWLLFHWCVVDTIKLVGKLQEKVMMSTIASFPQLWNQGLSN